MERSLSRHQKFKKFVKRNHGDPLYLIAARPPTANVCVGRVVRVACDGCGAPFEARITSVASESEFTPPVIYSREERHRLVFMAKAIPLERRLEHLHRLYQNVAIL